MKNAWVPADRFLATVAGGLNEGLVHIFDLGIQIGDDDALRALLDCLGEFAQLCLGFFALNRHGGQVRDMVDHFLIER